jgi:RNA polymerase sigma-70 factor (ECF subfamily)
MQRRTSFMELTAEPVRSFEDFYRAEWAGLRRAVGLVLGDKELARTCVEEAMGRAYGRWDRVAARGRPAGWVYREALDAARRRGHRVGGKGRPLTIVAGDGTVADPEIAAAVARLPLDQRSVVVLHFYLDWSTEDVAEALGTSPGSVAGRLRQALRRLETTLGEQA